MACLVQTDLGECFDARRRKFIQKHPLNHNLLDLCHTIELGALFYAYSGLFEYLFVYAHSEILAFAIFRPS